MAFDARGEIRDAFAKRHTNAVLRQSELILGNAKCDGGEDNLVCARCCLQVLISASAGSAAFQSALGEHNSTMKAVLGHLDSADPKLRQFSTMLVKLQLEQGSLAPTPKILSALLATFMSENLNSVCQSEALAAIRQAVSKNTIEVGGCFNHLLDAEKCAILDVMHEWPEREELPMSAVKLVPRWFREQSTMLLTTFNSETSDAASPLLTMRQLDLLCDWTSADESSSLEAERRRTLQDDTSLLIDAVYLLQMVHQLGADSANKNLFTPVKKLSELDAADVEANPVFGFKRDLVRLIGNMCWKHTKNQDTARETDAIPLLLDCSPIDANNPIMMQWVVFAMRNLCDDNAENQTVIASIDKHGTTTAQLAEEFGVKLNTSASSDPQ